MTRRPTARKGRDSNESDARSKGPPLFPAPLAAHQRRPHSAASVPGRGVCVSAYAELCAKSGFGADGRTRTGDMTLTKRLLYQLSYIGSAYRSLYPRADLTLPKSHRIMDGIHSRHWRQ